jgi:hypothetical protein
MLEELIKPKTASMSHCSGYYAVLIIDPQTYTEKTKATESPQKAVGFKAPRMKQARRTRAGSRVSRVLQSLDRVGPLRR